LQRIRQRLLLVQRGDDDGNFHESKELMAYGLWREADSARLRESSGHLL
jgi:hypothetical protein